MPCIVLVSYFFSKVFNIIFLLVMCINSNTNFHIEFKDFSIEKPTNKHNEKKKTKNNHAHSRLEIFPKGIHTTNHLNHFPWEVFQPTRPSWVATHLGGVFILHTQTCKGHVTTWTVAIENKKEVLHCAQRISSPPIKSSMHTAADFGRLSCCTFVSRCLG